MKTTQQLKSDIYREVQTSGIYKEVQSKLKTEVLHLIEKESNANKQHLNFQYEHPLLSKMRKYPLTSLCLDLMQEFMESFKFKHTLNVFKKEINRDLNINRQALAENFGKIELNNPNGQAVLLSIVGQIVSGEIRINESSNRNAFFVQNSNFAQKPTDGNPRVNNFISPQQQPTNSNAATAVSDAFGKKENINSYSNISNSKLSSELSNLDSSKEQNLKSVLNESSSNVKLTPTVSDIKPEESKSVEEQKPVEEKKDGKSKKKGKKEVEKPPEGAADLMGELMGNFKIKDPKKDEEKKNKLFEQKRAFSEEKMKKEVDEKEQGANKIRGVSAGKMSSFMSKFMKPQTKNQSFVDEEIDQFEQSRDSTRRNPLYSSTESGFDKSGFYDQSVDSHAIEDFEYIEKAKKFKK